MQTIQLTLEEAKVLYPTATKERRAELKSIFGKQLVAEKKSYKDITTIEDIFEATGADASAPEYTTGDPGNIALSLIRLIARALNPAGWKPDYNSGKQRKWYPVFWMDNPGFRFDVSFYSLTHTYSSGGSRTVFAEEAISDHAAKYFLNVYKAFYE